jgi:hypothetical protein
VLASNVKGGAWVNEKESCRQQGANKEKHSLKNSGANLAR